MNTGDAIRAARSVLTNDPNACEHIVSSERLGLLLAAAEGQGEAVEALRALVNAIQAVSDAEDKRDEGDCDEADVDKMRDREHDEFYRARAALARHDAGAAPSVLRPLKLGTGRDALGVVVREAWVAWARTQSNPKPSWLVPFEALSAADQEADRQIGEAVRDYVRRVDAADDAGAAEVK